MIIKLPHMIFHVQRGCSEGIRTVVEIRELVGGESVCAALGETLENILEVSKRIDAVEFAGGAAML